jgi:hypothetical protein
LVDLRSSHETGSSATGQRLRAEARSPANPRVSGRHLYAEAATIHWLDATLVCCSLGMVSRLGLGSPASHVGADLPRANGRILAPLAGGMLAAVSCDETHGILAPLNPKRIRLPQPFDAPTDRTSQLRANRVMPLISLAFLVSLLSACDGEEGGKWSTCEGYREDVTSGSAQDLRDSRNGRNPCD